jgi:hypothetical protein
MAKFDSKEEMQDRERQNMHNSDKRSKVDTNGNKTTDDDVGQAYSDSSSEEDFSDKDIELGSEDEEDNLAE